MTHSISDSEYIKVFFETMGKPEQGSPIEPDYARSYKGKLPDSLINYWLEYGFTRHSNGIFWIVDPAEFEEVKNEWIKDTPIEKEDNYYVFARSGFGKLFLWGTKTGNKYVIDTRLGWIIKREGDEEEIQEGNESRALYGFLVCTRISGLDVETSNDEPLFDKAINKYGPLESNEVFSFEPAIFMGGDEKLKNISKSNIFVHLSVLAQFGHREILDTNALIQKAFGK